MGRFPTRGKERAIQQLLNDSSRQNPLTEVDAITQAQPNAPLLIDGHVHSTTRVYWEGIDPWQPKRTGWKFARATQAGVNVIIENVQTYGYWYYNQTPKHTLRLIETFHRFIEAHQDQLGLALTAGAAREIVASGRMAIFLGIEAGFDHEGEPDVLRALYRLGVRSVQFATQTGFNAFADVHPGLPGAEAHWGGLSGRGRTLVKEMNRLGILIDITHASEAAQEQIIAVNESPVAASHLYASAVSGPGGLSDEITQAVVVELLRRDAGTQQVLDQLGREELRDQIQPALAEP